MGFVEAVGWVAIALGAACIILGVAIGLAERFGQERHESKHRRGGQREP